LTTTAIGLKVFFEKGQITLFFKLELSHPANDGCSTLKQYAITKQQLRFHQQVYLSREKVWSLNFQLSGVDHFGDKKL